jgi:myosin heavy subunit
MKSIFDEIEEINEQNIWPSFTDVMMVVLMIFILAMVVTITHNTNLFKQLLSTKTEIVEKEKYLKELEEVKRELNAKINDLEVQLSNAQMKILMLSDENKKLKENLEGKIVLIGDLSNKLKELTQQLNQVTREKESLQKLLEEKEKLISEKETLIIDLRTEKEKLKDKLQELESLKAEMQQKYSELQEKYLKLVGPARSPLGKEIFKVKYFKPKPNSKPVYLMMGVNENTFKKVSYNTLLNELEKAKNKYGKKLYVQIIIPSNSNLTYDEAFKFTNFILHKYDYYYQK